MSALSLLSIGLLTLKLTMQLRKPDLADWASVHAAIERTAMAHFCGVLAWTLTLAHVGDSPWPFALPAVGFLVWDVYQFAQAFRAAQHSERLQARIRHIQASVASDPDVWLTRDEYLLLKLSPTMVRDHVLAGDARPD